MINKNIKRTGIPMLDDCLKGGIPLGKTLLFYGSPLAESDVFLMQAAYTNLAEDEVCYYVTCNYSPEVVRYSFEEYGWDTSRFSKRFEIVDAYSPLVGVSSPERFSVKDPESIESFDETITAIIEMLSPGDMLMLSSLSSLFDHCSCDDEEVMRFARKWNKMAVLRGGIMVYSFMERDYGRALIEHVKNGLCNATVLVGGLGEDTIYGHYFKPHSCDWSRPQGKPTLFRVAKPGGITVHIPKILVTGPQGSGKSTFVRSAATLSSGKCVSIDRMGTTIAGDHAQVTIKGFSMDLFGTPGQKQFLPTLESFAEDAMGTVVVVDSTDRGSFERASEVLGSVNSVGVPFVVAASKQDVKGALSVDGIRKEVGVPESVPVIGVCASKGHDVQRVLETLIGMVVESPGSAPVEGFEAVVNDLMRVHGVKAAAIVSSSGILKAAEVPGGVHGERLAFAAYRMLIPAEAASDDLDQGRLDRLVVEVDEHKLIVMKASEKNMLVVLADASEGIGAVALEMDEAIEKIRKYQESGRIKDMARVLS